MHFEYFNGEDTKKRGNCYRIGLSHNAFMRCTTFIVHFPPHSNSRITGCIELPCVAICKTRETTNLINLIYLLCIRTFSIFSAVNRPISYPDSSSNSKSVY